MRFSVVCTSAHALGSEAPHKAWYLDGARKLAYGNH